MEIVNTTSDTIPWNSSLYLDSSDQAGFSLSPSAGALRPGTKQEIRVKFDPSTAGIFVGIIQLIISYLGLEAEFSVKVSGFALYPSIVFDPPEIFLPVVALGVTSTAMVWISNNGCENGDIIAEIPNEIKRSDITFELTFPEGRTLKEHGRKLPCLLKFTAKSGRPVSFTIRIPFQDSEFSKYYLTVHGTSDASVTSLQALDFIHNEGSRHLGARFQTPVGLILESEKEIHKAEAFWTKIFEGIIFWVNESVGAVLTEKEFPENLLATNGKAIGNLIFCLAGKKFAGIPKGNSPEESVKLSIRYYNEILTFLTMNGAMLSSVKAEFLLRAEDFKRSVLISNELQKVMGIKRADSEFNNSYSNQFYNNFRIISKEAWCTLFLQVIRIYLLPSTNQSLLKVLPDSEQSKLQPYLDSKAEGSEGVLLAWVKSTFKSVRPSINI